MCERGISAFGRGARGGSVILNGVRVAEHGLYIPVCISISSQTDSVGRACVRRTCGLGFSPGARLAGPKRTKDFSFFFFSLCLSLLFQEILIFYPFEVLFRELLEAFL